MFRDWNERDMWIGLQRTPSLCGCPCGCPCGCEDVTSDECDACRSKWSWSDDTSMTWQQWLPDEPTDVFECGRMTRSGWSVADCNIELRFICERGMMRSALQGYEEQYDVSTLVA